MASDHQVHNVVRLLSGGPAMTIMERFTEGGKRYSVCTWFDNTGNMKSHKFSDEILINENSKNEHHNTFEEDLSGKKIDIDKTLDDLFRFYMRQPVHKRPEILTLVAQELHPETLKVMRLRDRQDGRYLPGEGFLNAQEAALLREDTNIGYKALFAASAAESLANLKYDDANSHNGNGDAFRHAYWSCNMVVRIGANWAKRWGDAHEIEPGQPAIEKEMDLWNNQLGRNIGTTGPATANFVQENIRSGVGRRIVNNRLVSSSSEGETIFS